MDQNIPAGAIPEEEFNAGAQEVPTGAIPEEELKPSAEAVPAGAIPEDQYNHVDNQSMASQPDLSKFQTPGQQMLTAAEGAAQGASFGLSNKLETALGFATPEEIANREKANPGIHSAGEIAGTVGSTFIPIAGEGWLLAKAGKGVAKLIPIAENAGRWTKIGQAAIQGALKGGVEMAGMQAGDELGKSLIGQGNSSDAVAMHIIGSGALGMLLGTPIGAGEGALKSAADEKLGQYLQDFSAGIGAAKEGKGREVINYAKNINANVPKGFEHGVRLYEASEKKVAGKLASAAIDTVAGAAGSVLGPGGSVAAWELAQKYLNPHIEKLVSKVSEPITKKVIAPVMLRAIDLGKNVGVTDALDYAGKAAAGDALIKKAIDATFKKGTQKSLDYTVSPEEIDKMDDYIDQGGINQQIQEMSEGGADQEYAKGGIVQPKSISNGMADLYPDQNIQLSTAKGRVSNYLTSLKPQKPINNALFDVPYHDKETEKSYRNAISVAIKPLSVLKKVQDGTIKAEDVKHLAQMYPEVHDLLSRKITEHLVQNQIDEKRPNGKTLQGLSLFLGTALRSEMNPTGIQAAQAVFMPKQSPQGMQPGMEKKKNKSALSGIPKQAQTAEQARDARANKD